MTKHKHEWSIYITDWGETLAIECDICDKPMSVEEADRRLNATEELSAEEATRNANCIEGESYNADALRAYAERMEAK